MKLSTLLYIDVIFAFFCISGSNFVVKFGWNSVPGSCDIQVTTNQRSESISNNQGMFKWVWLNYTEFNFFLGWDDKCRKISNLEIFSFLFWISIWPTLLFYLKSEDDVWFHLSEILISCVIMQLDCGLNFSNN